LQARLAGDGLARVRCAAGPLRVVATQDVADAIERWALARVNASRPSWPTSAIAVSSIPGRGSTSGIRDAARAIRAMIRHENGADVLDGRIIGL
jgi:hypothetical protein